MRTRKVLAMACAAALLALGAAEVASATRLSFNSQRMWWRWNRDFKLRFESSFITTECNVTMRVELYSAVIVKRVGTRVGQISEMTREGCDAGTDVEPWNITLPWVLEYEGYSGTLPRPTGLFATAPRIRLTVYNEAVEQRCEYYSTVEDPWRFILHFSSQIVNSVDSEEIPTLTLDFNVFWGWLCSPTMKVTGFGTVPTTDSGTAIRVTLI